MTKAIATKPVAQMTPQELAHHGIPVEVALRARIEACEERAKRHSWWVARDKASIDAAAYKDALAIIEAKL